MAQDQAEGVATPIPAEIQIESIEAWEDRERERQEEESEKKILAQRLKGPPATKKLKPTLDLDALAAEQAALEEMSTTNWVGKLQEYRNVNPDTGVVDPAYTESESPVAPGNPRFSVAVAIKESSQWFGGESVLFRGKKDAKKYAAKQAIDWLIANNHMPGDGTVKFRKLQQPQLPSKPTTSASPASFTSTSVSESSEPAKDKTESLASQVNPLCHRLGFNTPQYWWNPDVKPPFYSGYAHFGNDPRIEGKIGVIKNVYGSKTAKEEIAKELVSFLKDIERQRLEGHEDEVRKRKREPGSSHPEQLV
ncbi:hypothetical protein LSUE1_G000061 [Lachnellula suecica]|uniref:DRBM domain-containing protein n=1 Tax=Lachnellula suecica TaxID=602035 RepID=A0A8T9CMY8_9HELO|nr:hypothetical protein LSUE1_G000061 [Lachnellula suecica]